MLCLVSIDVSLSYIYFLTIFLFFFKMAQPPSSIQKSCRNRQLFYEIANKPFSTNASIAEQIAIFTCEYVNPPCT